MNYLAPSVLAADFSTLGNDIAVVAAAGAQIIHLDVMDGTFVPNISFGAPVISSVRKVTGALFDVHLMINEPIRYVEDFKKAGADMITVHYEACNEVKDTLLAIHSMGVKAGIAISPDTPVSVLASYLNCVDMILVMSVYPGFGGQSFIEDSILKIRDVKAMAEEHNREGLWIEVDGGIDRSNIEKVKEAGANVMVAGSAVFRGNIIQNVKELKDLL